MYYTHPTALLAKKKKSQKTNTQTAGWDSTAIAPALFKILLVSWWLVLI